MEQQPSVIQTGDFLYFAPTGQAYTIPAAGTVSSSALPDASDPIWTTFALGTVMKTTTDKVTAKEIPIMAPMPGTGMIRTNKILRPSASLTVEAEMNEISRTAMAGFYKSPLIQTTDTSFVALSGEGSIEGWLKRQRYDGVNGLWIVDDYYVDLNVTDLTPEDNVLHPKFVFTWLYSSLAAQAI